MSFVYTTISFDKDGRITQCKGFEYSGEVAACCGGPSASEKQIQQQQQKFYNTLTLNYNQMFTGQTAILQSLSKAFAPILAAGPGQFGYTPAETAAMRTQATEGTAQAYKQASQAVGSQLSAAGGGQAFLPSGGMQQIESELAGSAALQNAQEQLGITTSGYQQGYNQFMGAAQELSGVAQQYNPTGLASTATGAGQAAFGSAQTIQQQEQAASPWNTIGGILGGAAGLGLKL